MSTDTYTLSPLASAALNAAKRGRAVVNARIFVTVGLLFKVEL
jgi:hypothetical protein